MRSVLLFTCLMISCVQLAAQQSAVAAKAVETVETVQQMPYFYDENCLQDLDHESKNCAQKALLTYIYGNLIYPEAAKAQGVEGMAVVSFVVDADGWVKDPKIVRDPGAGTGEEALRVIASMKDNVQWDTRYQGRETRRRAVQHAH